VPLPLPLLLLLPLSEQDCRSSRSSSLEQEQQ
jgi:hypothetical protein